MSDQINLPQNWVEFWSIRLNESHRLTNLLICGDRWVNTCDVFLAMGLLVQAINDYNERYGIRYEKSDWLSAAPNLYQMHQWSPPPKNGGDTCPKTVSCATLLEEITALENTYQGKRGLGDLFENSRRIIECYIEQ